MNLVYTSEISLFILFTFFTIYQNDLKVLVCRLHAYYFYRPSSIKSGRLVAYKLLDR